MVMVVVITYSTEVVVNGVFKTIRACDWWCNEWGVRFGVLLHGCFTTGAV